MAEYVCPFCGDVNAESADSEELDLMMECPRCGGSHLHRRRPTTLKHLAEYITETTAARGVDIYAVEECGLTAAEWARMTDRDRSTVSRNIRRAQKSE